MHVIHVFVPCVIEIFLNFLTIGLRRWLREDIINVKNSQVRRLRELIIDTYGTFKEGLVRIMESQDQVLQRKTVRQVKVLWQHREVEEATWEREDTMRATYHFLFKDEGTLFSHLVLK